MKNYTDWGDTDYFKRNGIPVSCCKDNTNCSPETLKDLEKAAKEVYTGVSSLPTPPLDICLKKSLFLGTSYRNRSINLYFPAVQGCFTLVTNTMEGNLGIIAGISFGIAFFQVHHMLFLEQMGPCCTSGGLKCN